MDEQKQLNEQKKKLTVSNESDAEAIEAEASSRSLSRLPEAQKFSPNKFVGACALSLFILSLAVCLNSSRPESGVWWCSMFVIQSIFIVADIDASRKTLRTVRLAKQRRYGLVLLIMILAFTLTVLVSQLVLLVRPCDLRIFVVAMPIGVIWAWLMGGWDNIRKKQINNPDPLMISPKVDD